MEITARLKHDGADFILVGADWLTTSDQPRTAAQARADADAVRTLNDAWATRPGYLPLQAQVRMAAARVGAQVVMVAPEAPLPDGAIA